MKKIKYYPQKDLLLKADVPGAKMWAVALNKAMLTYFEIEPKSKFDMHSHKSEQITMVLHGELFFEIADEETICVKTGEVIAIPSNIKHSVYTQKNRVKAIDAWSPIRKEYIRTLKIQKATATDSENILEVQKLAYQSEAERYNDYNIPPLKQTIDELKRQFKTHIFLKAISDEKIVGTVRAYEKNGTCYVGRLAVLPDKQNQGIGRALMKEIENHFSPKRFELFVGAKSDKNIRLYNKLGYKTFNTGTEGCGKIKILYMEKFNKNR